MDGAEAGIAGVEVGGAAGWVAERAGLGEVGRRKQGIIW